jgi:hypothetical protein
MPTGENELNVVDDLRPEESFERRFYFIGDDTLRKNIAIAFEYIVFLIGVAGKDNHKKLITSSLYKDTLIYTGIVVEACLTYVLLTYISESRVIKSKVLTPMWKEISQGIIHSFSKKKRIRYVVEHQSYEKLKNSPDFIEVNRACLRAHILNKKEYAVAEEVRVARNKIHVSGLKDIDNSYCKEDLDKVFAKANKIITKVEKKLLAI